MRKIREVLRLTASGVSAREVARSVGMARSTVADCLRRAEEVGLRWPLPTDFDEAHWGSRLYPPAPRRTDAPAVPEWPQVHAELSRKGVTLFLLWQEYKAAHRDGYQYSRFCDHYRAWASTQDAVLRLAHTPGDKLFVDYAGHTAAVVDRLTGEIRPAQLFVAVLGHSSYTYAEATWTQTLPDWIGAHVRALDFIGGAPLAVVPDNLKSGVTRAHRYDPDINPSYQDFAEHYGVTVLPARPLKPRDKAAVENGVLICERFILARLRDVSFFSLAALNEAIRRLIIELNAKPFQKRDGSRLSVFEAIERPALRPLPTHRYEYATWKQAKVHLDYHVEVERHYYSVPHALIGKTVDVRLTASTIEILLHGQRVAAHLRSELKASFSTIPGHRPERHQAIVDLSHEKLLARAEAIGPATAGVLRAQVLARKHPEHALRASLGILRLAQDFSGAQLEAACHRALQLDSTSYRAVRALLNAPLPAQTELSLSLPTHANVRGPSYYH